MGYKLSKVEVLILATGVLILISCVVALTILGINDMVNDRQIRDVKARCKTVGGEMGYSKCYKNGKEI
jgi:lipoprotein|nr:MAG TPA: hypothetical protein [Caudoviricetes sp.]